MSEKATEPEEAEESVRHELLRLLLEKVRSDQYPSSTMLDIVEDLVTPEEKPLYAQVLMAKIQEDQFPSLDLIRRARALGS